MAYINTTTGDYPLSAADVRAAHSNTSFPSEVAGFEAALVGMGYAVVQQVPEPAITYTQNIAEGAPAESDGTYQQTWVISNASAEEVAERTARQSVDIRQERNQRLADCDWTQLPDAPVDAAAWATYRQELRNVTSQAGFPWEVNWPAVPGETVLVRARNEDGTYVADDPATPQDEAYVEVPISEA